MKKWNVRSWDTTKDPKVVIHQEVIEAQIKTEALNRFFEKHPEDRNSKVTAAPVRDH